MIMKTKLSILTVCLALLVAFNVQAAEDTLKFANPVVKGHSWGRGADKFSELTN